ncbi:MAG: nucleotidyltransferase domain-containing protein [Anaerolineales bacterium]|nr:nucleotidyltransferase domain-containing protein [Anaerolineales bacterium]
MSSEKLNNILCDLRDGLAQLLGDRLEAVYLYGSQARGDARPDSDIDVLITLRGEFDYFQTLDQISDLAWKLSLENDVVIAQVLVSKEKFARGDSPFLMNVRREAVLV